MWEQRHFPSTGVRFCFWHMFVFEVCVWLRRWGPNFLCCLPIVSYKSLLCYLSWKMVASLLKKTLGLKALSPCHYCPLWLYCNLRMFTCCKGSARSTALHLAPRLLLQAALISICHMERCQVLGGVQTSQKYECEPFGILLNFNWFIDSGFYPVFYIVFPLFCLPLSSVNCREVMVEDQRVRIL